MLLSRLYSPYLVTLFSMAEYIFILNGPWREFRIPTEPKVDLFFMLCGITWLIRSRLRFSKSFAEWLISRMNSNAKVVAGAVALVLPLAYFLRKSFTSDEDATAGIVTYSRAGLLRHYTPH